MRHEHRRNLLLSFIAAFAFVGNFGFSSTHKKSNRSSGKRSRSRSKGSKRTVERTIPTDIPKELTATLSLPEDRCVAGKFTFPGGSCPVLARGITEEVPPKGREFQYTKGKQLPNGKPCYFLKEQYNKGATPIPSKGYYISKFATMGGKPHWNEMKQVSVKGKLQYVSDSKRPTPVFDLFLGPQNYIPPNRSISSILIHTHGLDRYISNLINPTYGCPKLPPDCLWKFYDWSKKNKHPYIKILVKKK